MKETKKIICTILLLGILTSLGGISVANASISTAPDKALAFIEDVLPIDSSQYEITLSNYGVPNLPDIGVDKQQNARLNNEKAEVITYSLKSKDSTMNVVCTLYDGVLYQSQVGAQKGHIIPDKSHADVAAAAKSFLEKLEAYSNLDSTEMTSMLSNVDPTKNTTITSGTLTLTITHKYAPETSFGDSIDFRWVRTINGCEYLLTDVVFRDGAFSGFIDHRARYTIGDTKVNISKDQAIAIAMEYIKNYSYQMAGDYWISGFNVTEDKTVALLKPTVKEDNVLYPHWSVTLYLNQTYPGSVTSILLGIWADPGEVFFCHHQAYGGSNLIESNSDSENSFADANPPPTSSSSLSETPIDNGMVALIAVAVIAITVTAITLIIKKRSK
ncbi:MAG: hypothetical protein QM398_02385 [Thermoproteota archaeon]|nr:hypothetical protein [Thermoproteota archaeon]